MLGREGGPVFSTLPDAAMHLYSVPHFNILHLTCLHFKGLLKVFSSKKIKKVFMVFYGVVKHVVWLS